jgi:hypothetical protein
VLISVVVERIYGGRRYIRIHFTVDVRRKGI